MLYLIHGEDTASSREKANSLTNALLSKKPDASLFRMDDESWSAPSLEEYISGQGLFESRYIVLLDHTFSNTEAREEILGGLKKISESENVFILLEGKMDKKTLSRIEKRADKVQGFALGETKKAGKDFDVFKLTDAFGRRDKGSLWVLFEKAKRAGVSSEEIHGIIFWQLKSILTVLLMKNPKDAGLNPFVLRKSLSFSKNYTAPELKKLSREMVSVYHDARRGIVDFSVGLERFFLKV